MQDVFALTKQTHMCVCTAIENHFNRRITICQRIWTTWVHVFGCCRYSTCTANMAVTCTHNTHKWKRHKAIALCAFPQQVLYVESNTNNTTHTHTHKAQEIPEILCVYIHRTEPPRLHSHHTLTPHVRGTFENSQPVCMCVQQMHLSVHVRVHVNVMCEYHTHAGYKSVYVCGAHMIMYTYFCTNTCTYMNSHVCGVCLWRVWYVCVTCVVCVWRVWHTLGHAGVHMWGGMWWGWGGGYECQGITQLCGVGGVAKMGTMPRGVNISSCVQTTASLGTKHYKTNDNIHVNIRTYTQHQVCVYTHKHMWLGEN